MSSFPTWEQIEHFVMNAGLAVFLVVFAVVMGFGFSGVAWATRTVWRFFRLRLEQGFDKHFALIDKLTLRVETESDELVVTVFERNKEPEDAGPKQ